MAWLNLASRLKALRGALCWVCGVYALAGCTNLASGTDKAEPLMAEDPQWACVENGDGPPVSPSPPLPVLHYQVAIVDFAHAPSEVDPTVPVANALIPNLKIQVCSATQIDCDSPVKAPVTTPLAALGYPYFYNVDIPGGLDTLYLKVIEDPPPADPRNLHLPLFYYFAGPLIGNAMGDATLTAEPIPVPTFGQIVGFGSDFHVAPDPADGTLAVRTIDCKGKRAAGVTLELSPPASGAVSYTLTRTGIPVQNDPNAPRPTDARGVAGFANLAPGALTVSGLTPNKTPYGNPSVRIVASAFTLAEVRPDSLPPQ